MDISAIVTILLGGYIIFGITQSVIGTKSERLFYKRKIIEVKHADGTTDYTVKVNGLLGLPFLYQTDLVDYGLYEIYLRGMTYREAKDYVDKKEKEYLERRGSKVVGRRKVYPTSEKQTKLK